MEALVNRLVLLETLKENRDKHRQVFEEAQEGYRTAVIAELDAMLAEAKAGKRVKRAVTLPEPVDQTKDYDRVIRMLEMDVREDIELEEHEVAQYVLDDWRWKDMFTASNVRYVSAATAQTYGMQQ
jgi:hypothetical protein